VCYLFQQTALEGLLYVRLLRGRKGWYKTGHYYPGRDAQGIGGVRSRPGAQRRGRSPGKPGRRAAAMRPWLYIIEKFAGASTSIERASNLPYRMNYRTV
jgi:hypothetical protein